MVNMIIFEMIPLPETERRGFVFYPENNIEVEMLNNIISLFMIKK